MMIWISRKPPRPRYGLRANSHKTRQDADDAKQDEHDILTENAAVHPICCLCAHFKPSEHPFIVTTTRISRASVKRLQRESSRDRIPGLARQ
jgi:hypothetical protein